MKNLEDISSKRKEALLVLRAQLGDRQAMDELFRSLSAKLLRYIGAIVRNSSAEDVLQDVFLIIHQKIRWLDKPESFQSWVYRLAGREAIRSINKGRRRQEMQLTEEEWERVELVERSGIEERLHDAQR